MTLDDLLPWEQRPGEPDLWFARFTAFRMLGADRSLERLYRALKVQDDALKGERPGQAWRKALREWAWDERAAAWDKHLRDEAECVEPDRRFQQQLKRRSFIDDLLRDVLAAIQVADLPSMDMATAREALPTLRMFIKDLFIADRLESGETTWLYEAAAARAAVDGAAREVTVDDMTMALAARQLDTWRAGKAQAREPAADAAAVPAADAGGGKDAGKGKALLVVIGSDPALAVDVAMLRGVKRETKLAFHVLRNASSADLDAYLRRERSNGRPVAWLHIAAHASHEGIELADGLMTGDWLSARLLGVEVLLLAACRGDRVGDWLKVVGHVVTVDEAIGHGDASSLTEHFWTGLAQGMDVDTALTLALERTPPVVAESVVRHW